ncbi:hypothetical protein C8R42DRAFT_648606 [Lentinula raphanica]|nr:hypothetical protein C8R42DRAFT_648606 [Lentinula raphanica]
MVFALVWVKLIWNVLHLVLQSQHWFLGGLILGPGAGVAAAFLISGSSPHRGIHLLLSEKSISQGFCVCNGGRWYLDVSRLDTQATAVRFSFEESFMFTPLGSGGMRATLYFLIISEWFERQNELAQKEYKHLILVMTYQYFPNSRNEMRLRVDSLPAAKFGFDCLATCSFPSERVQGEICCIYWMAKDLERRLKPDSNSESNLRGVNALCNDLLGDTQPALSSPPDIPSSLMEPDYIEAQNGNAPLHSVSHEPVERQWTWYRNQTYEFYRYIRDEKTS